jgi:hypothetical protein
MRQTALGAFMDCSKIGKGHASSRCTKDGEAPIGLERVNNGEVVVGYTWGIPGDRLEALASSALPGLETCRGKAYTPDRRMVPKLLGTGALVAAPPKLTFNKST